MMFLQKSWCFAAAAVLCSWAGGASAQVGFTQMPSQFRAALENRSTSPSYILITVVDGRSGAKSTGCIPAPLLLGAIAKEKSASFNTATENQAKDEALAHKDHVFTFHTSEALTNVNMDNLRSQRACEIIRSGLPAYMSDRSGQIRAGQP